ncbi:hypothetical protein AALO_G00079260 [Alosa alosa]|uniref:Uncharacterized protein n=1 Tax=Alosa alosa TaxID=278164 RepID=A0AAV6GX06_9TELE|nr:uncharacterized protein LOC125296432 [Alosa alosa]KAG5279574.1 hypothetical protein AALO_G00079260 [Alosa alosa]
MANASGSFNGGPPDLGEVVHRHFNGTLDVDICTIRVLRFTRWFSAEELQMIRRAFIVEFTEEDLNWVMEKIIRYVSFLALDILTPALMVCREMENKATQRESAALCLPVVLVQAAAGSGDVLKDAQDAGEAGTNVRRRLIVNNVESPMPDVDNLADLSRFFSQLLRQSEDRQISGKVGKCVVDITTMLLETLVPGYAPWIRGFYGGCQDVSEFLRRHRHLPAMTATFSSLIETTSEMLTDMRRCILYQQTTGSRTQRYIQFEDFIRFIFKHFISESIRTLLERLMNAPNGVQLFHTSVAGMEAAEMPLFPQLFMPERDTVRKQLIGAISKDVTSFLSEATDMTSRKRALSQSMHTETEGQNIHTNGETETDKDMSVSSPHLPENSVESQESDGHTALVDRGVTGTVDASSISDSTCSISTISSRTSSCSSISSDTSSNEDSADVKSTKGGTKQRRKRSFTIHWRVKRSVAPAPVVEEPSVATEKTRRPSLKSHLASAFSRLCCCCCKGQE